MPNIKREIKLLIKIKMTLIRTTNEIGGGMKNTGAKLERRIDTRKTSSRKQKLTIEFYTKT